MRSTFRTMLVAALALCALGAFTSASASAALPEFEGASTKFTGSGGGVYFETPGGQTYKCETVSITGTITPPKAFTGVVLTFHGPLGCAGFCKHNAHPEEWATSEMKGRIGYLPKPWKGDVGLLLEPVAEPIAECEHYGGSTIKIQGSVIGKLESYGTKEGTTEYVLTFKATDGKEEWRSFEGEEILHELDYLPVVPPGSKQDFSLGATLKLKLEHRLALRA
jgi:hypothetical protein